MTEFAADWLRLRAPFDAAARNGVFAARFGVALGGGNSARRRIVDLAAGSGANFMALAPLIEGDQDWLLLDSDATLLAAQAREIASWSQRMRWRCRNQGAEVTVETGKVNWHARAHRIDLAQSLDELDLANRDGVTTSAFLDLVSSAWLDRLCALLARHALPLLAVLTVDGRREWHPTQPDDARIHAAFARHQARNKGFGPALGSHAAGYLAERLAALGYGVSTAHSDWRIGAEHREMLARMAEESAVVARRVEPASAALFNEWLQARHAQIRDGALTLRVGHIDLLALPA